MFKVLIALAYSYLNLQELLTIAERIAEILKRKFVSEPISEPIIAKQIDKLYEACEILMKVFQRSAGNTFTEQLSLKDMARDHAFRTLVGNLDGIAMITKKPEASQAAKDLLNIIAKHDRSLYRFGYARESAALYALQKELSQEGPTLLLKTAGATELFDDVKTTAKEFEDLYQSKLGDIKTYPETAAAAREIIYRLNFLLTYTDVRTNDEPQMFEKCADELNMAINDIMTPARARNTRQDNEKKVDVNEKKEDKEPTMV